MAQTEDQQQAPIQHDSLRRRILSCLSAMDTEQRLEALLHERVFGQKVTAMFGEENVSLGWCFRYQGDGYENNGRDWFRIIFPGDHLNNADRAFYAQLTKVRTEDRFFVLRVSSDKSQKDLTQRVRCVEWKEDREIDAAGVLEEIVRTARRYKNEGKSCFSEDSGGLRERPALTERLNNLCFDELYNNAMSRLLMNEFLRFASDVDAVILSGGGVYVVEYKRKPPAKGMFPVGERLSAFPFIREMKRAQTQLRRLVSDKLSNEERKGLHFTEVSELLFEVEGIRKNFLPTSLQKYCFGLDVSHASTVEVCEEADIGFYYLILDSYEKRATKLLTGEGEYVDSVQFRFLELTVSSFSGVAFTNGRKSGSYDRKVRLQCCTLKSKFKPMASINEALGIIGNINGL